MPHASRVYRLLSLLTGCMLSMQPAAIFAQNVLPETDLMGEPPIVDDIPPVMEEDPAMHPAAPAGVGEDPTNAVPPVGTDPTADPLAPIATDDPALPSPTAAATSAAAATSTEETITLYVGDILELLPAVNLPDPSYSWILTQDRTFIEANRANIFRKRLIQPGTYTLYAEITAGDQSARITRTFTLIYQPRLAGTPPITGTASSESGATMSKIVTTVPTPDPNGRIILADGSALLKLEPLTVNITPIALDLNTEIDANGDGIANNDVDDNETFFHSDATPLYVWFASMDTAHNLAVTAIKSDGTPIMQTLQVMSKEYAQQQGLAVSPIQIDARSISALQYSLSATFTSADAPSAPLLYHWEFGDGQQSILPNPTHTYAAPGDYMVVVKVQNLVNGKEIGAAERQISVTEAASSSSATMSEAASSASSEASGSGFVFPARFRSILLLLGIFLGSIVAGLAFVAIVARLRKKKGGTTSMADRMEAMEETFVKKEKEKASAAAPLNVAQPPSAASKQAISQREVDEATTNPVLEKPLRIDETKAPVWLKSGLEGNAAATPAKQQPAAVPPAQPTTPQTSAAPTWLQQKPQPTPEPQKPTVSATSPEQKEQKKPYVPPWITQQPPVPPSSAPVAKPQTPEAAKPMPAAPVAPATQPDQKEQKKPYVPPWITQKPASPAVAPKPEPLPEPATTATPAPPAMPPPAAPKPVPTPPPAAPAAPVTPVAPPQTPTPEPAKPATPAPVAAPAPVQEPIALPPAAPPVPAPAPQPVIPPTNPPAAVPSVTTSKPQEMNQTVAVIRAESLEKKPEPKPEEKK